jgi:EPS-associated MarR family transcriptional regulator
LARSLLTFYTLKTDTSSTAQIATEFKHLIKKIIPDKKFQAMNMNKLKEEITLQLIKIIHKAEHKITQRDLAQRVGISLGKINACISEMIEDELIKINRFNKSDPKSSNSYMLTPKGLEEKFRLLIHILSRKIREHEVLGKEIEGLNQEIQQYSIAQQQKQ